MFWYRITHAIREEPEEKILDALLEGEEVENPSMLNPNRCARPGGVFQTPFAPAFRDEGTRINRRVGLRFSTLAPQRRRRGIS